MITEPAIFIAITFLIWVYVSRFTSAGVEPLQATLDRLPKNLDRAAQSLGSKGLRQLFRLALTLLAPGAFAAGLILFVEILKELPATLMLRPFGWDTLAVQAYRLAADERLEGAAVPSLVIVAIGLVPVIILCRRMNTGPRSPR